MVDVRPFKAILYTKKAGDLRNLITPPYDKIDSKLQKKCYAKSPFNFCRLVLPVEKNKYETANKRIQKWLQEGLLMKDTAPALFVYRHEFTLEGRNCARTGLLAASRLYDYRENRVFPHEVTHGAPKADRLNMLRSLQKDLEPVFMIFSDADNQISQFFEETKKTPFFMEVEDAFKIKHTIWRVTDPEKIKLVQKALKEQVLVITDGHHRYESALIYRDERREKEAWTTDTAFNFQMSYICSVKDEGLVVLPTHRLLKKIELTNDVMQRLKKFFEVSEISPKVEAIESFLKNRKQKHAFCIYDGANAYGLLLKDEQIISEFVTDDTLQKTPLFDVVILRDLIFKVIMKTGELKIDEDIDYVDSTRIALQKVNNGNAKLAFLVNCLDPEMVWRIAQKRERLPEKSTDFYPKPVSGLMIMDISQKEKL